MSLSRTIACLLTVALLAQPAMAAEVAASRQAKAVDVTLQEHGTLIGQCLSENGKPLVDAKVRLTTARGVEAVARTDATGTFAFRGVQGAVLIESPQAETMVRCWSEAAAPPKAAKALMLVANQPVLRGQQMASPGLQSAISRSKSFFSNPVYVAGVVTTAVAIPVAFNNVDDEDPNS